MTVRLSALLLVLLALGLGIVAGPAVAQEPRATVLLDTYGFWRMHQTLEPPLMDRGGTVEPVVYGYEWIDCPTQPPAAGWTAPDFDDSTWLRGPSHMAAHTPYLSRLAMRGTFTVADPAQAGDLVLTLVYHGGAIVTLNGKEVARGHLAKPGPDGRVLAESYPADAFLDAKGGLLRGWDKKFQEYDADSQRRIGLRTRTLKDVRLPRELLRQGVNVLAIELVRAPYPAVVETKTSPGGWASISSKRKLCEFNFDTCELVGVQLTATGAGVTSSAVRAAGVHLWNGDVLAGDFDLDFGGQAGEPLRPVRIVAARNAAFSGKFAVGSSEAIRKLTVRPGDLAGPGGAKIPAAAVQVRYAQPWGTESYACGAQMGGFDKGINTSLTYRYWRNATLLGALMDAPPAEVAPVKPQADSRWPADPRVPAPPEPAAGAVVPVWLTVHVPKGAAAGRYGGRVAVTLEGSPAREVPLEVTVCDWTAPDPADFGTWIDMIQSPDTLALEYNEPLWTEKHWAMIARSMDLLRGVGNRVLYVPLIAECNHGNAESMVRWIDLGGGKYDWDFSIMDKYLDTCLKHMGRPDIIVLYAWDIYLAESKQLKPTFDTRELGETIAEAREAVKGKGPAVTVLDRSTGKVQARYLPVLSDPASKPLWKGMFDRMKKHFEDRGLSDRLMLGTMSDAWPSLADANFFLETAGPYQWLSDSHTGIADFKRDMEQIAAGKASPFTLSTVYPTVKDAASELKVLERAGYCASVWSLILGADNPTGEGRHGWQQSRSHVQHDRHASVHPMTRWHFMPEMNLLGDQGGVGRLGGDWWNCVRDKQGRRIGNPRERYPYASWRNLDLNVQMLAPGPTGAVATHRFENLREGVLECEARIVVEKALMDPATKAKLGDALAKRAAEVLRRRANLLTKANSNLQMSGVTWDNVSSTRAFYMWPNVAGHCWLLGADWQGLNEELFTVAGQVAAKLGGK